MRKEITELFSRVSDSQKLIHCITNPISITQCANSILALGCRPIMAEHPKEAAAITQTADAVLLNLGNITDARIRSIGISAKTAHQNNIPFVIDAVGAACSELRRKLTLSLLNNYFPTVLKGNYSEITAIDENSYKSSGIDAEPSLDEEKVINSAKKIAKKYKCVVLASGKRDIVTDSENCVFVENGTEKLSQITGTGCMLGAVTAVMLTGGSPLHAAVASCGIIGICGELAENIKGTASFLTKLIDNISTFETDSFELLKMEVAA